MYPCTPLCPPVPSSCYPSMMAALWTLFWALSVCLLGCEGLTPPQAHNLPPSVGSNSSSGGGGLHVDAPMALRVFSLDYHHVQAPFEIVLWIMLASLAKLGKTDVSAGEHRNSSRIIHIRKL